MSILSRLLLELLTESATYRDGTPGRGHITGLTHALRVGGYCADYSDELGFAGLVHDLARPLSEEWHGETMAEIIRERVTPETYIAVAQHGAYQTSAIHGTPLPAGVARTEPARVLAHAEELSFQQPYPGRRLSIREAHDLIGRWAA